MLVHETLYHYKQTPLKIHITHSDVLLSMENILEIN